MTVKYGVLLFYSGLLFVLMTGSVFAGRYASAYDYFKFMTNISWTLQILFYLYSVILFFNKKAFYAFLFACYFPLLGLTMVIFVLINVIFQYSSVLLYENIARYGIGAVITGNSLQHGMTVLALIVFGWGYAHELADVHRMVWRECQGAYLRQFLIFLYQSHGILLLFLLYSLILDPQEVYHTDMPEWLGWVVSFGVLLLIDVVYIVMVSERPYSRALRGSRMINDQNDGARPKEPSGASNRLPVALSGAYKVGGGTRPSPINLANL